MTNAEYNRLKVGDTVKITSVTDKRIWYSGTITSKESRIPMTAKLEIAESWNGGRGAFLFNALCYKAQWLGKEAFV